MGCLKIGGRVIGATDGPSMSLPACYRSANARKRLGCDAEPTNAVEAKKRELGLDNQAETDLRLFLEESGMSRDLIETACKIAFGEDDGSLSPDLAADRAFRRRFPNAGRLKHADGYAYSQGYQNRPHPKLPEQTEADRRRFDEMFPNARRLK